ncbi:hypothetical protein Bca52824_027112 [Brassica carinata]|uniref:Reverse transcriptase zinc-binding domain-containing protein n=1 Tax=Brassica carinata TaxID=52824 RepID=A0A8X7V9F5_BRACI|nr:hypothetical protein Bca52824_027112 [Brassica carinata]
MLQLKHLLPTFLRCAIGNGDTASFWYDYWTDLGPLHLLFGSTASRTLRLQMSASVSDAVRDGHWNLPPARSQNAETLQIVLSTIPVPFPTNNNDTYLWRSRTGGFGFISSPPVDIPSAVSMCLNYSSIYASQVKIIMKLLLQVLVYSLWRERNGRIFRDLNHQPAVLFKMVDRQMRDRLLSLSPAPNAAHSLLELYFWFIVPFS